MSAYPPVIVHSAQPSLRAWSFSTGANQVRCLLESSQTAGKLSFFESVLSPGVIVTAHVHDSEDEYWYMLDAGLEVRLGSEKARIEPSTVVAIPAGTLHELVNTGDTEVRSLFFTTPGGLEDFFAGIDGLNRSSESTSADFARLFESTGTRFPAADGR